MRLTIISAILTLLWAQLAAPQPRTESIEGIVVSAGTDVPLPEVQVKLTASSGGSDSTNGETLLLTDAAGRFAFKDLAPGRTYSLSFARSGFVRKEYGRSSPPNGTSFRLEAGQSIRDMVVSMTQTGDIDGRITDDRGQPMEGIQVRLERRTYNAEGVANIQTFGTTRTNDRGQYRLYWVTPGRYYVRAEPHSAQGDPVTPNVTQTGGYGGTYYPGTIDSDSATVVDVKPGGDVSGIDWSLRPARADSQSYHVRGTVIDSSTGQPPRQSVSISISKRIADGASTSSFEYSSANAGTFEVPDVNSGTYWVGAAALASGFAGQISAQTLVTVSNRNVEGITLVMIPTVTIDGRVRTDGSPIESAVASKTRVELHWVGGRAPFSKEPQNPIFDGGTFRIFRLPPGPYKFSLSSLPPDYFVKGAMLGGKDILTQTLEITGPITETLDVLISDKSGRIDGTVVDARRQPAAIAEVVLIPNNQRDRSDLYKHAITDANGRFTMRGIPPGNYKLFAWENIEPFAYFDAEFVRQSEPLGRTITVGELSRETVEIRSIP